MSTNDREPRTNTAPEGLRPLVERRVDPGLNTPNPPRVDDRSKLSVQLPKGRNNTGDQPRMPVKR